MEKYLKNIKNILWLIFWALCFISGLLIAK